MGMVTLQHFLPARLLVFVIQRKVIPVMTNAGQGNLQHGG